MLQTIKGGNLINPSNGPTHFYFLCQIELSSDLISGVVGAWWWAHSSIKKKTLKNQSANISNIRQYQLIQGTLDGWCRANWPLLGPVPLPPLLPPLPSLHTGSQPPSPTFTSPCKPLLSAYFYQHFVVVFFRFWKAMF